MTTPEPPKNPQTPSKPPASDKKLDKQFNFKPLGTVRDYFTVQMEQDASWNRYR